MSEEEVLDRSRIRDLQVAALAKALCVDHGVDMNIPCARHAREAALAWRWMDAQFEGMKAQRDTAYADVSTLTAVVDRLRRENVALRMLAGVEDS